MSASSSTLRMPLPVKTLLGNRYEIEKVLPARNSSHSLVYKAKDTAKDAKNSDSLIVIKELFPEGCTRNPNDSVSFVGASMTRAQYIERFLQEKDILRKLGALMIPSVAPPTEFFEANETCYMVMPHVGDTTSDMQYIWREGDAIILIEKIGAVVKELHKLGYVHTDIRPSNIIISDDASEPVLIGFDYARKLNHATGGVFTGTGGFAPPEQQSHSDKLNEQADVYGLAATCCYLMTGHIPPIVEGDPISKPVKAALAHALHSDVSSRTKTVEDFLDELSPQAHGLIEGTQPVHLPTKQFPHDFGEERNPMKDWISGIVYAVLLLGLAGIALAVQAVEDPPPPPPPTASTTPSITASMTATTLATTTTPTPTRTNTPTPNVLTHIQATASAAFWYEAVRAPVWGTPLSIPDFELHNGKLVVVQYFEKGRMEYDPQTPIPTVVGGLLTTKLLEGEALDTGILAPPCRPMFDDGDSLTYHAFSKAKGNLNNIQYFYDTQKNEGFTVITINQYGSLGINFKKKGLEDARLVRKEKDHYIPLAFCNHLMGYLQLTSRWCDGYSDDALPPAFWNLTGYPITEPFWTTAHFRGHTYEVMFQAFERRLLTYTRRVEDVPSSSSPITRSTKTPMPTSTPTVRPEISSSNVGVHYYEWRGPSKDPQRWACPP